MGTRIVVTCPCCGLTGPIQTVMAPNAGLNVRTHVVTSRGRGGIHHDFFDVRSTEAGVELWRLVQRAILGRAISADAPKRRQPDSATRSIPVLVEVSPEQVSLIEAVLESVKDAQIPIGLVVPIPMRAQPKRKQVAAPRSSKEPKRSKPRKAETRAKSLPLNVQLPVSVGTEVEIA